MRSHVFLLVSSASLLTGTATAECLTCALSSTIRLLSWLLTISFFVFSVLLSIGMFACCIFMVANPQYNLTAAVGYIILIFSRNAKLSYFAVFLAAW
jgi:hypothetical protein